MGDYTKRVQSTQRNSSVTAGYAVDFIHVPPGASNFLVCTARSVVTLLSINIAPNFDNVIFKCGSDIVMVANIARDYKMNFYAYAPITISVPDTVADVTVYVAPNPNS